MRGAVFWVTMKYLWAAFLVTIAVVTALWPGVDITVSRWFYAPGLGFSWAATPVAAVLREGAAVTPIYLGTALLLGLTVAVLRQKLVRPWLFLLLALLLGPGVIANLVFKDHWGRARPVQTEIFGGTQHFTPWWHPARECQKNCAFFSGDAAYGFIFPALAGVLRARRRWLWGGTLVGIVMGGNRIMMGAHFASDVAWAALMMLGVIFALYAAIFGRTAVRQFWQEI